LNPDEPRPGDLDLACPVDLTEPAACAEWHRAIVPAIQIGQITDADRVLAIAHCDLWAQWRSQSAEAARHPHVIAAGSSKYPMPNPARVMANKTLQLLAQIDEKLGFSPTSRSRVVVPTPRQGEKDRQRAAFLKVSRG
jgi:P27 family predicted phage terminase small subunit